RLGQACFGLESLEERWALSGTYATGNDWGGGFQGQVAIQHDQSAPIKKWLVEFDYTREISNLWDATLVSHVGNHYVIESAAYNSTIAVGQTISFGFVAGAGSDAPSNITLNGSGTTTPPPTPPSVTVGDVTVTEGNPSSGAVS